MDSFLIPWGDGNGNIVVNNNGGDVQISSDTANIGAERIKTITFTTSDGKISREMTVTQKSGEYNGGGYTIVGIQPKDTMLGDIVFAKKTAIAGEKDTLYIGRIPQEGEITDIYDINTYEPIGVVVIPGCINFYGNGQCGVVSLTLMSPQKSFTGDYTKDSFIEIKWEAGDTPTDIPELINYNRVKALGNSVDSNNIAIFDMDSYGTAGKSYFPTDANGYISNPLDPDSFYYSKLAGGDTLLTYAPSPYLNNTQTYNIKYEDYEELDGKNVLSDKNGLKNTKMLVDLSGTNWIGIEDKATLLFFDWIPYPAACLCYDYRTKGTKPGHWYLPSMGELGFLINRRIYLKSIFRFHLSLYNNSLSKMLDDSGNYISSSENGLNYWNFTALGLVDYLTKTTASGYDNIYAFIRL